VSTQRPAVDQFGLDPIGRLISSEWLARLRSAPALTEADYVDALIAHANASPDNVENLFSVRAGIPLLGESGVRGQSRTKNSKELWIHEWRARLSAARNDRLKAIRAFGPEIVAAYNDDSLWLPQVQFDGDRFKTSLRMRWSTTKAALWHALRLILENDHFYKLLGQCQHCGIFFLAKREHPRGRLRTEGCSKDHADAHNKEADKEKARTRARKQRRRQKESKSRARRRS